MDEMTYCIFAMKPEVDLIGSKVNAVGTSVMKPNLVNPFYPGTLLANPTAVCWTNSQCRLLA